MGTTNHKILVLLAHDAITAAVVGDFAASRMLFAAARQESPELQGLVVLDATRLDLAPALGHFLHVREIKKASKG